MQHEQEVVHHAIEHEDGYLLDTLGAPFKVILRDGVTKSTDQTTGEEIITVPDIVGLIGAVVRSRVSHTRKLSGAEIKFIRHALGVQAKVIAEFLGVSPEHLSRCENGTKAMSLANEKLFRCAVNLATRFEEPGDVLTYPSDEQHAAIADDLKDEANKELVGFLKSFFSMKINPVYVADDEPLTFEFTRKPLLSQARSTESGDDKWRPDRDAA